MPLKEIETQRRVEHRRFASKLFCFFLPAEIIDVHHGIAKAESYVLSKKGLLMISSHMSHRDGPATFMYLAAPSDALVDKIWLAPVAKHIAKVTGLLNRIFRTDIDLNPVVTPNTASKKEYAHLNRGEGLIDYMKGATRTLREGGIVVLFPQSTRRSYLGEPEPEDRAMELLMSITTRRGVNDFGILPVGFGIDGVTDYSKVDGVNPGTTYNVRIGDLWTKKGMLQYMEETGATADAWAVSQLRPLVPPEYRSK